MPLKDGSMRPLGLFCGAGTRKLTVGSLGTVGSLWIRLVRKAWVDHMGDRLDWVLGCLVVVWTGLCSLPIRCYA